jgi:hypothetical protein
MNFIKYFILLIFFQSINAKNELSLKAVIKENKLNVYIVNNSLKNYLIFIDTSGTSRNYCLNYVQNNFFNLQLNIKIQKTNKKVNQILYVNSDFENSKIIDCGEINNEFNFKHLIDEYTFLLNKKTSVKLCTIELTQNSLNSFVEPEAFESNTDKSIVLQFSFIQNLD